jgi:flagellar motor protein MotB
VAAGGGGSWKVAYADFVTAMMAFFMVMWICAQDQQTREAVAHYFNEPFQFFKDSVGAGRTPEKQGALFKDKNTGEVPKSEEVAQGHGRKSYTQNSVASRATKRVSDWLHANDKASEHWQGRAGEAIKKAALSVERPNDQALVEDKAAEILGDQMKEQFKAEMSSKDALHNDLLGEVLTDVNWTEIAEDFLRHERIPNSSSIP